MQRAFDLIKKRLEKQKDFHCSDSDWDLANYGAYSDAIEIVNQVASEYGGGWIPCSERLPEEDEKVIVSTKTERVYVGVYTKRYGFNEREGFICEDGFMWMNNAIAWQSLPTVYEPYKAESEE